MFLDVGTHILHASLFGDRSKPAVVLLHSLGASGAIWERQVEALAASHFLICPDLRGHGLSRVSLTPFGIDDLAADIMALLDALHLTSYHVCGLSIGGLVAQAVAGLRPDRILTLTLFDSNIVSLNPPMWRERAARCRADGLAAIADSVLARWTTAAFRDTAEGKGLATMDRGHRVFLRRATDLLDLPSRIREGQQGCDAWPLLLLRADVH
ncbi:alpha/beta fold hydrolase [Aquabacter sp. P-9]|uniref:alpha/beta fold hydrolase n=1 Tax=Aquabacter sediminis TaxID=3029197 RepID=UPI00237EACD8|nr:alpha/beta fold hydrolase [Aquabacter sp. P-9]MDE1571143.1 alpha/beta fold hydrolase [Aquabacter sp. P-9]